MVKSTKEMQAFLNDCPIIISAAIASGTL